MHQEENPLFFFAPVDLLDSRIQVVVPTFAALLSDSAVQMLRDQSPLLRTIGDDELKDTPVLLGCPCALYVERLAFSAHSLLGVSKVISIGRIDSLVEEAQVIVFHIREC